MRKTELETIIKKIASLNTKDLHHMKMELEVTPLRSDQREQIKEVIERRESINKQIDLALEALEYENE